MKIMPQESPSISTTYCLCPTLTKQRQKQKRRKLTRSMFTYKYIAVLGEMVKTMNCLNSSVIDLIIADF